MCQHIKYFLLSLLLFDIYCHEQQEKIIVEPVKTLSAVIVKKKQYTIIYEI